MFEDLQHYIPEETIVSAKDMNTLGEVVRMARNFSGADFFVDSQGIYFRKRPAPSFDIGTGEFQGMVLTMTTDLVRGWDVLRTPPFPVP